VRSIGAHHRIRHWPAQRFLLGGAGLDGVGEVDIRRFHHLLRPQPTAVKIVAANVAESDHQPGNPVMRRSPGHKRPICLPGFFIRAGKVQESGYMFGKYRDCFPADRGNAVIAITVAEPRRNTCGPATLRGITDFIL